MGNKELYKEFAIALVKESKSELERSKERLIKGDYPYSIFHAQQSCEKVIKALLELEKVIVRVHELSSIFEEKILPKYPELKEIKKSLFFFEIDRKWARPRYPVKIGGRVLLPEEIYKKDDAVKALEKTEFVFKTITKLLKEKYGIE